MPGLTIENNYAFLSDREGFHYLNEFTHPNSPFIFLPKKNLMKTMMLKVYLFFLMVPFYTNVNAQSWEWQHPKPQGNGLFGIHFIDQYTGWAAGAAGTILQHY